jgi:hypothetical protein
MILLSLLHGLRVIQVPVNYLPRVGVSSVTGDMRKAIILGFKMVGLVLRYRVSGWLRRRAAAGATKERELIAPRRNGGDRG